MHITYSSLLGILFLGLALAATFTMFHFWGYPYDEVKKKSSCPQWKMNIHRGIGFAYVVVYILMMSEMVPRLWEYQVEFPARTVVHIVLGTAIGVILLLKISILRFFRHFEEWMPTLGVSLLMCSVLLGVLSLPAAFRERSLAANVYTERNLKRVAQLLPDAGFPDEVNLITLSTKSALEKGRTVLLQKCVVCHDLKTIITKPRTPSDWVRTSKRMVNKPSLGAVIEPHEGHLAAAYLIAITPDLQRSAKLKRAALLRRGKSQQAVDEVLLAPDGGASEAAETADGDAAGGEGAATPAVGSDVAGEGATPAAGSDVGGEGATPAAGSDVAGGEAANASKEGSVKVAPSKPVVKSKRKPKPKPQYNMKEAKALFQDECSLCHDTSDVDDAPPTSRKEVNSMLARMVDNGLELDKDDLSKIRFYLLRTYVKSKK